MGSHSDRRPRHTAAGKLHVLAILGRWERPELRNELHTIHQPTVKNNKVETSILINLQYNIDNAGGIALAMRKCSNSFRIN